MPSLHTYLIQEAIDQGQMGEGQAAKMEAVSLGPVTVRFSRLCSAGGHLQERERQALKSSFVYPKPLQGTPAHNSCPQSCPLCYHGRECRELLRPEAQKHTTVTQSSKWGDRGPGEGGVGPQAHGQREGWV